MKKVVFHTLGCKTNQYDSEAMLERLMDGGYELAREGEPADVVIVNTCTVTAEADRKSRQMLRQASAAYPGAVVVAAGCYAQREPKALARIAGVDLVLGNQDRGDILNLIRQAEAAQATITHVAELKDTAFEPLAISQSGLHTRANIKIQEGCNRFCTYCIIPYARGPIRSRPLEDTVQETARLAALGVKEFVLTGIHIASYGLDMPGGPDLITLLEALDQVEGMERLRLGSLEPSLLTDEFCARAARLRHLCPHFHLSLQSGCDATLRRMNRHYTAAEYKEIVHLLRRYFDNPAMTTDVMVGFPGETDEEFEASLAFVKEIGFAKAHVFAYSRRPGTRADQMDNQVAKAVKEERSHRMIALSGENARAFLNAQIGSAVPVLFESYENGRLSGLTAHYANVTCPGPIQYKGTLQTVRILSVGPDGLTGTIIEDHITE